MMKKPRFELEIDSRVENLPVVADFVEKVLERFGADPASIYRVQLAVDEACTNVMKHAYGEKTGLIRLGMELIGDSLVVTVNDRGRPFDPDAIPPPDLDADLEKRRIGGLGIYFMKKLMDEVSYSFDSVAGNRLTMRKSITRTGR
ncbi:MAG: ATP-binding protein [Dehalococcoidales bacterium]|nr:ATP-binding protein [Dehalococcoidales bacterium]